MTQTAVEWLFELSKKRELDKFDLEQAKAMEKEQIIDAFGDSRILSITNNCNNGIQYYNETYGGKDGK
jgi:hypothetical protein